MGSRKVGVIIGGSGLIGGTLLYYFKTQLADQVEVFAPNSKKVSLRVPEDIHLYCEKLKPDFIINAAIASIDSDPQLAFEVNYLGSINLAKKALELKIPYIHLSSAAILPPGENLTEEDHLPLSKELSNYSKSKLMAELTLKHLHKTRGLDYTAVRLAVVYGKHDHKIQGFHRLFFSIVDQAMPFMLTKRGVMHSYSNAKKFPLFIHHALEHRQEFSGETYNFVDRSPVELAQLILTIKSYMELKFPKEIYMPYHLARAGKKGVELLVKSLIRIGIEAKMPGELMFLDRFYRPQTLSTEKLERSSFIDPSPQTTIFTELPDIIQYYVTRWEQLNLIEPFNKEFFDPKKRAEEFLHAPEALLESIHSGTIDLFSEHSDPCRNSDLLGGRK